MTKKLFLLTLCSVLAIGCAIGNRVSINRTMTNNVQTQAQLDEGNQRINQFRQQLLDRGFREVSFYTSNLKEQSILEGYYEGIGKLRVTLWTGKELKTKDQLGGGIEASLRDEKAEKEFNKLYDKVVLVVTGRPPV